ncbi:MAG: phospholipase D family protein [Proteobacteria bacterium]|nr:phospholipase D family protein [Burkholderiales bacterium]
MRARQILGILPWGAVTCRGLPLFAPPKLFALFVALLVGGCGTLPLRPDLPVSAARAPTSDSPLARIAAASIPSPELSGVRLMPLGVFSLDARLELAQRARNTLDVQYYEIKNDLTGRLLLRHLRDAAMRGVRVRLLVDDLFTAGNDSLFAGLAAFPNVEVRLFNPFCCGRNGIVTKFASSLFDFGRLNHRMHNKLFIADDAMVVTGGRNVADEYFMRSMGANYIDMDAFVVGAIVPQLSTIFDTYWNSPYVYPVLSIVDTGADRAWLRERFDRMVDDGDQMMSLVLPPSDVLGYGAISEDLDAGRLGLIWAPAVAFADPPAKVTARTDEQALSMSVATGVMDRLIAASDEVMISTPYLIPGAMGVAVFADLVKRNVKVTIVTNSLGATDEPLVHIGYSRYRGALLAAGVDLYELSPTRVQRNRRLGFLGSSTGRLHAKIAVIDRARVFIGSMNLDPRSATKNTELGMIFDSPELAKEIQQVIRISKLQSAYRVRLGADQQSLEWLTTDDDKEVVLTSEPYSTFFLRLKNRLLAPFIPENQL